MFCAIRSRVLLTSLLIAFALAPHAVLAQSGSAGGSIGNDESRCPARGRTARKIGLRSPSPPRAGASRHLRSRAARRDGGSSGCGAGGNFDGAWAVTSVGCGGTTSGAVVVTSGRVIGEGVSGRVSPSGAVSTFGQGQGVTYTGSGRLSGHSGSGTFRRSDGCSGTWTSIK